MMYVSVSAIQGAFQNLVNFSGVAFENFVEISVNHRHSTGCRVTLQATTVTPEAADVTLQEATITQQTADVTLQATTVTSQAADIILQAITNSQQTADFTA